VIGEDVVLKKEEPILLYEPDQKTGLRPDRPNGRPGFVRMPRVTRANGMNYGQYYTFFKNQEGGTPNLKCFCPAAAAGHRCLPPHGGAAFCGPQQIRQALSNAMNTEDKRIFLATQKKCRR
jgi:hypothetical protein